MLKRLFFRWLLLAVAIALTAWLMSGIEIHGGVLGLLWVTALFAVVNLILGSLVRLFTLPLMLLTLGLFGLVVNALMLWLVGRWSTDLDVHGFGSAFWGALLITVFSAILTLTPLGKPARKHVRR